ncbi:MAG: DUF3466 family protein [Planctomycetes bacterium]|nr:DUF3466 family protein [Planctomycetota bacterium]
MLSDHQAGQESDAFTKSGGETNAELLAFKLDPVSGTITVTNLVFTITGLKCITDGDWAGLEIVEDTNGDGTISVGETTTVGGIGTVSQSGGTITFAGDFSVTAVTHYIVRADFAELSGAETVTIGLTTANITSSSSVDGSTTPVTHSDADVAGGLVSHWKFNETSGLTATDSVGINDGTLKSGATWTTSGKFCGALDFDEPSSEYVNVPADTTLNLTGDATITGWFKLDSNFTSSSTTSQIIVEKYDSDEANLVIALVGTDYGNANPSDGSLVFKIENEVGGEGYRYQWTTTTSWTAGTWYHFACTVDSSNAANNNIYIDAVDDTNGTGIGGSGTDVIAMSFNAPLRIGGRDADTAELATTVYFNGVLDDVRLYNRILTAAEIQALAATYTVIDLGTYGGDPSFGFGINAGSIVAGYDENATTDVESAWFWTSCVLTDLGSLGGSSIQANDINDSGDVVGRGDTAGGDIHAFYYDGSLTDLGTLSGKTHSDAIGINNIDDIAGISYNVDARGPRDRLAFLDVPVARYGLSAGMNSLGTLGGVESQALDVNSLGEVVGGAQKSAGDYYPFIWLPSGTAPKYGFGSDGMNSLGTLGGVSTILTHRAHAINANGEIVGQSYTAGGDAHAFLWLPSAAYTLSAGMNDLGVLTGGTASLAFGINDSGQVVGASEVTGGDYHAFIWETGTMTDLNDLLDPNSTWELVRAMDINSEGEISGWGTNLSSVTQGFVLTTCTDTGAGSLLGPPDPTFEPLLPQREFDADEEPDAYDEPELIRRAPLPPLCGLGMLQAAFVTGAGFLLTQRRSRRCRSSEAVHPQMNMGEAPLPKVAVPSE